MPLPSLRKLTLARLQCPADRHLLGRPEVKPAGVLIVLRAEHVVEVDDADGHAGTALDAEARATLAEAG